MSQLFTSNQVARALAVSESSIKRWCNQGHLPVAYTAGGHRRIPLDGLVKFLRSGDHELVRPELLGLPPATGQTGRLSDKAAERLCEALLAGDEETSRRIVLDLFLADRSIARICDEVFAQAFDEVGERWSCGEAEVYQERLGCGMTLRLLGELRSMLPLPSRDAPLALGGAPAGDPYNLGTTMAELVLRQAGWNARSLGENLPFATLSAAISSARPRLFWISASHLVDEEAFLEGYHELYELHGQQVAFVVGGRALTGTLRRRMRYAAFCDNLQHLEAFAQTLYPADRDGST
ncbi:MAG: helix-turn-helix domain-containing protein [Planctomycetota bacterium]|nr:MAG: helix-turn-helix domain-containing protein [Planctomycetota bacterium]REJ94150.1 MAG: helix-turn-helix domain-containing protein [Planctomycetota bacterium]